MVSVPKNMCDYMFRKVSIFGLLILIVEGLMKNFVKFLLRW